MRVTHGKGLDQRQRKEAENGIQEAKRNDQQIFDIIRALQGYRELRNVLLRLVECKKDYDRASNILREYMGKQVNIWFESNGGKDKK